MNELISYKKNIEYWLQAHKTKASSGGLMLLFYVNFEIYKKP
jgi:hypothetical protein